MQPSLSAPQGTSLGPVVWDGQGPGSAEVARAMAKKPMGLVAYPDGAGAEWLAAAAAYLPDARLWWHCGTRLTPTHPGWVHRLVEARRLMHGASEWLELKWAQLPGLAKPNAANGTLEALACALPQVPAGPLISAWRLAPLDLFPDIRSKKDMRLSQTAIEPTSVAELTQLAIEGGHPSPMLLAWVIQSRFTPPPNLPFRRSLRRSFGIHRAWPSLCTAVGLVTEPSRVPDISEAAATVLEATARDILDGKESPDVERLVRQVALAESQADAA